MWKYLLVLIICVLFVSGCATSFFVKQIEAINEAEQSGKITTYEALQLKNDLYKSAKESELTVMQMPIP